MFFSIPESLGQVDWRIIWNIETDDDDDDDDGTVSEIWPAADKGFI